MAEMLLEAKEIRVVKGRREILYIPWLKIEAGQTLGIIGPNGAGKSTLLRVLGLIEPPTQGRLYWKGEVVGPANRGDWLRLRRRMATVFQETLLLNDTVYDNVALGLRFRGLKEDEVRTRVNEWLGRLGITHLARRKAHALSGGEARRVSLARAWVLAPEIIFLDEPFSNLDKSSRTVLLSDLAELIGKRQTTVVLVTHDFADLPGLVDRVLVLMHGTIYQEGTVREVLTAPASVEVASFVGIDNLIPGLVLEVMNSNPHRRFLVAPVTAPAAKLVSLDLSDQGRRAETGTKVTLCLRSQDVSLVPWHEAYRSQDATKPDTNRITGVISRLVPTEGGYRVEVDCGFPLVAWVSWTQRDEYCLQPGDRVLCSFSSSCLHIL